MCTLCESDIYVGCWTHIEGSGYTFRDLTHTSESWGVQLGDLRYTFWEFGMHVQVLDVHARPGLQLHIWEWGCQIGDVRAHPARFGEHSGTRMHIGALGCTKSWLGYTFRSWGAE